MSQDASRRSSMMLTRDPKSSAVSDFPLSTIIAQLDSGVSVNADDDPVANGEPGVLKVSCVSGGFFYPNENKKIHEQERGRATKSVNAGDLLVTRANTFELIASCGLVDRDYPNLFLPDKVWRVVLKEPDRDYLPWLNQVLNSPSVRVELKARASGTSGSMKNISQEAFLGIHVLRPPLAEQKAIAGVLSAWDRAIEQTTALIAAKQRLKQGLMQQLLTGKRRFKGFKDEWRECQLGDLFDDRREPGTDDLPLLAVTLDAGVIRRDSRDAPVRTNLEHEEHLLVRKDDIAYNMMRMWQGGSGRATEDGVVSPAYVVCKPKSQIESRFADHLFHIPRMIYLFWAYSYGLTDDRRRLYFDGFSRIPTRIPSLEEQRRIADAVDCLGREVNQLDSRLISLRKQKRGLMQKLLTGEVRVSDKLLKQGAKP